VIDGRGGVTSYQAAGEKSAVKLRFERRYWSASSSAVVVWCELNCRQQEGEERSSAELDIVSSGFHDTQ
jgi:hypothetical protein